VHFLLRHSLVRDYGLMQSLRLFTLHMILFLHISLKFRLSLIYSDLPDAVQN